MEVFCWRAAISQPNTAAPPLFLTVQAHAAAASRGNGVETTARKSEVAARMNEREAEREAPHIVALVHPPDGFGVMLVEWMTRFHTERGIPIRRGRRQRRGEQEYVRFCFTDAATADAFQARFGGERVGVGNPRTR